MLNKKEQITLKIKKLELINDQTIAFYVKNGFKCAVISLEEKIDSLKDESKIFMDSLGSSTNLEMIEKKVDDAINNAEIELNLTGGDNV